MATDREWPRVLELFEQVSALRREQRTAFLDALDGADLALRAAVEELLDADSRCDGFLEPPLAADAAPSLVGRRLGPYRVIRQLGVGGMGTVWEAEQDAPRRRVALKTMHGGLFSAQARRRFAVESELLAALRHPAIAQVYEAGVLAAADGGPALPWFALEFVEDARPLFVFAAERRLGLAQRLELFVTICDAVQHAHQRGVIHRDLKGANLLVDRDGRVKVIDFGVARASTPTTGATLAGDVLGTLEVMSPEQVQGRSEAIDARTDVYALGAVLYELCCGERPHRFEDLSLEAAARAIRELDAPPPSRRTVGLPREIDWIVAAAMAKDPARRYATALDLARDVQRLSRHEPVLAGPPTVHYRLRKFCRRHRVAVLAAAVAGLAVVAGAIGLGFGLVQEGRAREARAAARAESELAERFAAFMHGLFRSLAPEEADGRALTRATVLERGRTWLGSELDDRPLLRARLLRVIGTVHSGFGEFAAAQTSLEEGLALARGSGTAGEPELVELLRALAQVHRRRGEQQEAEPLLREALASLERRFDPQAPQLAPLLNELGLLLAPTKPTEAIDAYRRSLAILLAVHGDDHGDVGLLLANLATVELRAERPLDAIASFERALPIVRRHHGESDPRVGTILGSMAIAHRNLGHHVRALELQRMDLALTAKARGPRHPEYGGGLVNLAQTEEALGRFDEALADASAADDVLLASVGALHPMRLAALNAKARLLIRAERRAEAGAALRAAIDATGPRSEHAARALLATRLVLAEILRLNGDAAGALALVEAVLAEPLTKDELRTLVDARWAQACGLLALGRSAEAETARAAALAAGAALPARHGVPSHLLAHVKFEVLRGELQRAFGLLADAGRAGYRNAGVASDPAFAALRELPGWEELAAALAAAPKD